MARARQQKSVRLTFEQMLADLSFYRKCYIKKHLCYLCKPEIGSVVVDADTNSDAFKSMKDTFSSSSEAIKLFNNGLILKSVYKKFMANNSITANEKSVIAQALSSAVGVLPGVEMVTDEKPYVLLFQNGIMHLTSANDIIDSYKLLSEESTFDGVPGKLINSIVLTSAKLNSMTYITKMFNWVRVENIGVHDIHYAQFVPISFGSKVALVGDTELHINGAGNKHGLGDFVIIGSEPHINKPRVLSGSSFAALYDNRGWEKDVIKAIDGIDKLRLPVCGTAGLDEFGGLAKEFVQSCNEENLGTPYSITFSVYDNGLALKVIDSESNTYGVLVTSTNKLAAEPAYSVSVHSKNSNASGVNIGCVNERIIIQILQALTGWKSESTIKAINNRYYEYNNLQMRLLDNIRKEKFGKNNMGLFSLNSDDPQQAAFTKLLRTCTSMNISVYKPISRSDIKDDSYTIGSFDTWYLDYIEASKHGEYVVCLSGKLCVVPLSGHNSSADAQVGVMLIGDSLNRPVFVQKLDYMNSYPGIFVDSRDAKIIDIEYRT